MLLIRVRSGILESVTLHLFPSLSLRHAEEIHLIEGPDQNGSIPANVAVEVDRLIALISQSKQDAVHVFLGWLNGGGVHRHRKERDSVGSGLSLFRTG